MENAEFLRQIADYYIAKGPEVFQDIVFVCPNKRSRDFLREDIQAAMKVPARMPRIMTRRSFLSHLSGLPDAPDRRLLFMLYDSYRRVMAARNTPENDWRSFDWFVFWGDIILKDFDEIDSAMVNAAELFKNLKDVKEIQADYLDEEQKEVVRKIWGESAAGTSEATEFWKHVRPGADPDQDITGKFVRLWSILGDLYADYKKSLAARRLASPGEQYLRAVGAVRALDRDNLPQHTHYVFVGFNDISHSETLIYEGLRKLGMASFFWDLAPLEFFGQKLGRPLERLAILAKHFPMPDDFEQNISSRLRSIDIYAVPSSVEQAKYTGEILKTWMLPDAETGKSIIARPDNAIDTAVVLPEQGELIPLLFSLPDEISSVNVTMGLPYRGTAFATLLQAIIRLQLNCRYSGGRFSFFYKDVLAVLRHPHMRYMDAGSCDSLIRTINDGRMYRLSPDELGDAFAPVFTPMSDERGGKSAPEYIAALFAWLTTARNGQGMPRRNLEAQMLEALEREAAGISALADEFGVNVGSATYLRIFERLLDRTQLPVTGTPLKGLQILGVLETRTLDFRNVIVLNMNERIFPRRQYRHTMIPNSLRHGFGLPDFESLEWTYAYCFYRLVARAENLVLLYDSRSADGQELSRYITQLECFRPALPIRRHYIELEASSPEEGTISIDKNSPDVARALESFRQPGGRRLSASALKTYMGCGFQFYLKFVRGLRGDDERTDYFKANDYGSMVHNVIEKAFEPFKGGFVTKKDLHEMLAGDTLRELAQTEIAELVRLGNKSEYYGEFHIAPQIVESVARREIEAEIDFYFPHGDEAFRFVEAEYRVQGMWKINPSLSVNWRMDIDRCDRTGDRLRFIDFKTGADATSFSDIGSLFQGRKALGGIFQILTYCQAYRDMVDPGAKIIPVVHSTRSTNAALGISYIGLKTGRNEVITIDDYDIVADEFSAGLRKLIEEIFDPSRSFDQCEDKSDSPCQYCQFMSVCGRTPKTVY